MPLPGAHESANRDSADLEKANTIEGSHDNAIKPNQDKPEAAKQQPSNLQTILVLAAAFLNIFLVAVDRTIISTVCEHPIEQTNLANFIWPGHTSDYRRL